MYKILKAEMLAENIYLMDVSAPRVAKSCLPGQFVIVKIDEKGERIPLTGPLGQPSELCNEPLDELKKKKILFVAGGVGTAPVYPQVKWLKENGVDADVIVGAKTQSLLILENEMEKVAGNLYITTDDGSYKRKGMVTEVIKDLVQAKGNKYDGTGHLA